MFIMLDKVVKEHIIPEYNKNGGLESCCPDVYEVYRDITAWWLRNRLRIGREEDMA